MRRIALSVVLPAALIAAPALAQDADLPVPADDAPEAAERLTQMLSDPQKQQEYAATLSALGHILLDLPLAPLVESLEEATGEELADVGEGDTLRDLAPEAADLPDRIEDELPRAMDRMARMSEGFAGLLPALKTMAQRMEEALPPPPERARD